MSSQHHKRFREPDYGLLEFCHFTFSELFLCRADVRNRSHKMCLLYLFRSTRTADVFTTFGPRPFVIPPTPRIPTNALRGEEKNRGEGEEEGIDFEYKVVTQVAKYSSRTFLSGPIWSSQVSCFGGPIGEP